MAVKSDYPNDPTHRNAGRFRAEALVITGEPLEAAGPSPKGALPSERVEVRRWEALPGVELWAVKDSNRLFSAFHTTLTFCCLDDEQSVYNRWKYRRKQYEVEHMNDVMVLEPGETHQTEVISRPARFHVLLLEPRHFVDRLPHFSAGQFRSSNLAVQLRGIWRALEGATWDLLELTERLARLIHTAAQHSESPLQNDAASSFRLKKAKRYVEDLYSTDFALEDVAHEVGLHPCHLTRSFHAEYGMPLTRYRRVVRSSMALARIRSGQTLNVVAADCGYTDQAHMTREIRGYFGFTPGRFAKAQ